MDEQMAALTKEVHDLQQRQLQDRHESILRDEVIPRRISVYEQRQDLHSEYLQQTLAGLTQTADIMANFGNSVSRLSDSVSELRDVVAKLGIEVEALTVRMDKTDQRWNQLIDQLTREHRNGGKKC